MTEFGVCLGGTFNVLHDGHKLLLRTAFGMGEPVIIGLTSDRMAMEHRERVRNYADRYRTLRNYCLKVGRSFRIVELNDPYGPSVELPGLRHIVVSSGTKSTASEINRIRESNGLKALEITTVPLIAAADGLPISSTRILSGECDRHGNILRVLNIGIGSENSSKVSGVRDAFRLYRTEFRRVSFHCKSTESGVPEQPVGDEIARGAISRAREALRGNDLGVGIEAGLIDGLLPGTRFDVQFCAIADRSGRFTYGQGIGFSYPPIVLERMEREGRTVGDIVSDISGLRNVGSGIGAVGFLSKRRLTRRQITRDAVIAALIPRLNRELYLERT
ncbi:MAG: inosine/xanthosine triphosphatase [Candidatus Thermoplasmatota archaeon]|uniref:Probable inosine/xanthosine triphosphatase n=1 Tax=Candidatus Sysuiplasma superficiale TaxID=2823368 RepID=A0A8J7YRK2_9ARCH|nr:inosine/xanthosine triphosphatase [Candidatus Sysuiplasma superficiale]MCL4346987.1 inosine/xanthosine triphosphatase [Candidatus Thermoplasmatota archaeon]